jgi:hypothetical protein
MSLHSQHDVVPLVDYTNRVIVITILYNLYVPTFSSSIVVGIMACDRPKYYIILCTKSVIGAQRVADEILWLILHAVQ